MTRLLVCGALSRAVVIVLFLLLLCLAGCAEPGEFGSGLIVGLAGGAFVVFIFAASFPPRR